MSDGIASIKASRPKFPEAGNYHDDHVDPMTSADAVKVLAMVSVSATGMLYGLVQLADKFFPNIFN